MKRTNDLARSVRDYLEHHRNEVMHFIHHLRAMERQLLLRSDIQDAFALFCEDDTSDLSHTPIATLVSWCQEAALNESWLYLALRPAIARWKYLRVHLDTLTADTVPVSEFLASRNAWSLEANPINGSLNWIWNPFLVNFSSSTRRIPLDAGWSF